MFKRDKVVRGGIDVVKEYIEAHAPRKLMATTIARSLMAYVGGLSQDF